MEALLTDTLVSGQLFLWLSSQNPVSTPIQTLYFYIPVSRQLSKASTDTFRVYQLDFSLFLRSCEQTPEISFPSKSCILIHQLPKMAVCQNKFTSLSELFFFTYKSDYNSKHHLNFMLVTENCNIMSEQQYSQTLSKHFSCIFNVYL